ncbi:cytochrome c oxidase accessory protein CcoG [Wandonia haliotis]|uniref:Cytochrome c oxidase accessory protein CcoG n=1 Tax=Wandonia haliotis TaxID=574963 RepID=A0ABP3XZZ1_9FLAO
MEEQETYRDKIATVDEKGKRIWIFPKKPSGKFYDYRKWVSYLLLVFLFAGPHIKIGGEPMLMFNVIERKFVIFGQVFWPQDFYIFAIALVLMVVFIVLFTVIYGRLFCGWVCPQTIFMEMVFRRIEYWIEGDWTHQKKLDQMPWNGEKIRKRILKHAIFWGISFLIANTFLAYIIGADALWEIQTANPMEHLGGLIALIIFTTVFYAVFARLREQVCTTICPYGRLQGVLLDRNSIVITYDHVRGEERGKFRKNEDRKESGKGDCIDCGQCVNVCPTGIDIRNGTQLECVNCTACIDACDHMMESVGLEKGLIRYDSENGVNTGTRFRWTRRIKAYTAVLALLLAVLVVLVVTRTDFDATILRQRGATYQELQDGRISNIYEIDLSNKTKKEYTVELRILEGKGEIEAVVKDMVLLPEKHMRERFLIKMDQDDVKKGKNELIIGIYGNGELITKARTTFIGPLL